MPKQNLSATTPNGTATKTKNGNTVAKKEVFKPTPEQEKDILIVRTSEDRSDWILVAEARNRLHAAYKKAKASGKGWGICWADFCIRYLRSSRQHIEQLADALMLRNELETAGIQTKDLPANEYTCRNLAKIIEGKRAETWLAYLKYADGNPTAPDLLSYVKRDMPSSLKHKPSSVTSKHVKLQDGYIEKPADIYECIQLALTYAPTIDVVRQALEDYKEPAAPKYPRHSVKDLTIDLPFMDTVEAAQIAELPPQLDPNAGKNCDDDSYVNPKGPEDDAAMAKGGISTSEEKSSQASQTKNVAAIVSEPALSETQSPVTFILELIGSSWRCNLSQDGKPLATGYCADGDATKWVGSSQDLWTSIVTAHPKLAKDIEAAFAVEKKKPVLLKKWRLNCLDKEYAGWSDSCSCNFNPYSEELLKILARKRKTPKFTDQYGAVKKLDGKTYKAYAEFFKTASYNVRESLSVPSCFEWQGSIGFQLAFIANIAWTSTGDTALIPEIKVNDHGTAKWNRVQNRWSIVEDPKWLKQQEEEAEAEMELESEEDIYNDTLDKSQRMASQLGEER